MMEYIKKSVFLQRQSQAEVAQLVEHNLAKVGVASPSLVFRSNCRDAMHCVSIFFHLSTILHRHNKCHYNAIHALLFAYYHFLSSTFQCLNLFIHNFPVSSFVRADATDNV